MKKPLPLPQSGDYDANPLKIRERVLAMVERLPEGRGVENGSHLSLEVKRKRFGWFLVDHHGDGRIAIHCKTSDAVRAEIAEYMPDHLHTPKHVGHHGWIGLWLDAPGVQWDLVRSALTEAYRMSAPKTLAAALDV